MKATIDPKYSDLKTLLLDCIDNFEDKGELFIKGSRNCIKIFYLENHRINIKSFKVPNIINRFVYSYFRKSKASRSFEYANILLANGIGTPLPFAFFEDYSFLGLGRSYYVSEHLKADLTFRELIEIPNYPDYEIILRQFIHFTWKLHEIGIEFLDHSPGNTLIKKVGEREYTFFLVDLNRMKFHTSMSFNKRMMNMAYLTPKREMIALMSEEYAKFYHEDEKEIFKKLWRYTNTFQKKFHRKKKLKKYLKFWEKG